jgi:RNA recognition motif-containing protein
LPSVCLTGAREARRKTMSKNIYVGNLPFQTTDADLLKWFGEHGTVSRAQVVNDRETGRSRGFGFVEMATAEEAEAAVKKLNGQELDGRRLNVELAKPAGQGGSAQRGGGSRSGGGYNRSRW